MDTVVHIACLLASLPIQPPGMAIYNEMYLQAYPQPRHNKICGNVSKDVQFQLYTRANATDATTNTLDVLRLDDDASLLASRFDRRLPTAVFLHGFGAFPTSITSRALRDAFLTRGGYNMLMVDYTKITASPWYDTAVANCLPIGRHVARFIDFLAARGGLDLRTLHLVGLSLGAQVAAVVGAAVTSGRVGRITGLDPARPGFDNWPASRRLNPTLARFVDVIHTDSAFLGVNTSVGHVDFYPNGGVGPQPGCRLQAVLGRRGTPLQLYLCSHLQSHTFFVRSLLEETAFLATPCASWTKFRRRHCLATPRRRPVFMGVAAPTWARGNYYLSTIPSKLMPSLSGSNLI